MTVPEALPAAQTGFGEGGTCWEGGLAEAELCIDACRTGLAQSHEAFPDEPACSLCAIDEECDAEAGEVCVSGECVPLCVDERPFGCVCRADAELAAAACVSSRSSPTPDAIARILHRARAPPAPPPPGQLLLLP